MALINESLTRDSGFDIKVAPWYCVMECWFAESFTQHLHLNNMAAVGSLCFIRF